MRCERQSTATGTGVVLGATPSSTTGLASAFLTPVIATVNEKADIHEALEIMRANRVRRLLVVGDGGVMRGILSIDDIVDGLSADLAAATPTYPGAAGTLHSIVDADGFPANYPPLHPTTGLRDAVLTVACDANGNPPPPARVWYWAPRLPAPPDWPALS